MIVPLSTSSSSDSLPKGSWFMTWVSVIFGIVFFISFFEISLRTNGWAPSLVDSRELWSIHRKKIYELGDKAVILIGASRIQLGLDMQAIRDNSSYEPLQLAIDGASFMPVLKDFANDQAVKSTVLVSVNMHDISSKTESQRSTQWINYFNKNYKKNMFIEPYKRIDNKINSFIENHFVIRLEGAKASTVILARIFDRQSLGNYLTTHSDRSRDADYSKVVMPEFYVKRLERHFGKKVFNEKNNFSPEQILSIYKKEIAKLKPVDNRAFLKGVAILIKYIKQIESRGGEVILVRFPTDKLIWEIDQKVFPRKHFFNEIAKIHEKTIHFSDYPELSGFDLPDGSHLDVRDKKRFTKALLDIIKSNF